MVSEDGKRDADRPRRVEERRSVVVLSTRADLSEAEALVEAAGMRLAAEVVQERPRPDPKTYLGRGKLEEVREILEHLRDPLFSGGGPLVVANDELRPTPLFNLGDELRVETWDRIRLILAIFERNARVKEARLQVEYARLRYELPLVHEAIHRRMTGQRAGYMGGGEVEIRTYETHLRRRSRTILKELDRLKAERATRRAGRRKGGLRLVAIAGYTNSGKSSLLNELTQSEVLAEHRIFTTLQTATRRIRPEYRETAPPDLVLTDTVGFIRDLPPWLIDAFSSTLEEITHSDAVLLVVDASEPLHLIEEKTRAAQEILERIHAPRRRIVLLNKSDLIRPEQREKIEKGLRGRVVGTNVAFHFVSTKTKEGLASVIQFLSNELLETRIANVHLDLTKSEHIRFEHWLHEHTEIVEVDETGHRKHLRIRCGAPMWGRLLRESKDADATLHSEASTGN